VPVPESLCKLPQGLRGEQPCHSGKGSWDPADSIPLGISGECTDQNVHHIFIIAITDKGM